MLEPCLAGWVTKKGRRPGLKKTLIPKWKSLPRADEEINRMNPL
jgi:hypothetical protein